MMNKIVCFTVDVEPDFGGLLEENVYYGKQDLPKLERLVKNNGIKLTSFVTGKTLEDNPEILSRLLSMNSEIECHSYIHRGGRGPKIEDIERGIEKHKILVGAFPLGYRAPQGIISREEARFLASKGIKFDSSIFPTFFPGRFNHLQFPTHPFKIEDSNLLEIPFSVIPIIRIPIGLSYMQLLGFGIIKLLFRIFGKPDLLIFDFHSYELGKIPSYDQLSVGAKIGYLRAQKLTNEPSSILQKFISYILAEGYESKYMKDVYEHYNDFAPTWRWTGR